MVLTKAKKLSKMISINGGIAKVVGQIRGEGEKKLSVECSAAFRFLHRIGKQVIPVLGVVTKFRWKYGGRYVNENFVCHW